MLVLASVALAYETDQLTRRSEPLADSLSAADAAANVMLVEAVGRANTLTGCHGGDEYARRVLAASIYSFTSKGRYVATHGKLAGFGYGAFSAWLEEAPIDRREFEDRDDIYGDLRPSESLVLGTVGVCSTIQLGGVLLGTDKLDHFWEQGYAYYLQSRYGKRPDRAREWGVGTEKGEYGLLTSNTFSYADLFANWQGYRFYTALLSPGSPVGRDERGCMKVVRPFTWADWVDDALDEVLDPPVYTTRVREAVRAHLAREHDRICAEWAEWGMDAEKRRDAVIARRPEWVNTSAPAWEDEWGLDALCSSPAASGPGATHPP